MADALMQQLGKALEEKGDEMASKFKGVVVFSIDGQDYTIDLRQASDRDAKGPRLIKGPPPDEMDEELRITTSDKSFASMVAGKLDPQTAFMMGKLKIKGSMGLAMKLQPILKAAGQTQSKL